MPRKNLRKRALNNSDRLLVLGLGNPGLKYEHSRHNVGFLVIQELSRRLNIELQKPRFSPFAWGRSKLHDTELYLVLPYTYMNRTGTALGQIFKKTGCTIGDVFVVCDSLDLEPGIVRIKRRGGSGGQKGLQSIIEVTGTDDFARMFIGIGRPRYKTDIPRYVLTEPEQEETEILGKSIQKAADAIEKLTSHSLEQVMNEYNRGS